MTSKSRSFGNIFTPRQYFHSAVGEDGKYDEAGELAENNYRVVHTDRIWLKDQNNQASQTSNLPGRMAKSVKINELTFKVQSKVSESVKGHAFHAGKFLGEGKQAVEMTIGAIRDLSNAFSQARHGNFVSAARILLSGSTRGRGQRRQVHRPSRVHKDLAGRWLELQYGWMPLYHDVFEAWKAWSVYNDPARKSRLHVRCTDRDTLINPINQYYKNWINYHGRGLIVIVLKEQLSVARSLGLVDPAGVLWEITPYSFIIDWFLPIGSYLENLNILPAINGRMFLTTREKYMTNIEWIKPNPAIGGGLDHQFTYQVYLDRNEMSPIPVFPKFVSLPDAMSPRRIYNAIALAAQRVK